MPSLLSLTNTFLDQLLRVNELVDFVNDFEGGLVDVANTNITGNLFTIQSNNSQLIVNNGNPSISDIILIDVGPLSISLDDISQSNIASAYLANTARQVARSGYDQANTANTIAGDALGSSSNNLITIGSAFNKANAATTNVATVGVAIDSATTKTTPVDADTMPLIDSAASNALKKVTWTNIKTTLKTYFDTLYQPLVATLTSWAAITRAAGFDTFAATPSSSNLAALVTNETGTGALVFATSPTLVTPALGTPSSGVLTNM
ncbi:MAG: hypothetical protein WD512_01350, partial [Candidatus Paceibacterota bacterium]